MIKDPDRSCRKRSFPLRRAGRQKDIQMSYLVTDSVSPSFGESPALCVRREVPCERSSSSDRAGAPADLGLDAGVSAEGISWIRIQFQVNFV